jgi:small subunit ribosomal protein S14
MKRLVIKDKSIRLKYAKIDPFRASLKYIVMSDLYSYKTRREANMGLVRLCRKNAKITKVSNYCVISGRSKSVYKDFRLSRIKFRELARSGQLYGVTKSSW